MIIQQFPSGPFETNAYVIACPETRNAAIVDPAPNSADAICHYIEEHQLSLKMILITHSHWDHIVDTAELKAKFHSPVYIHQEDAPNLQSPGSDGLPTMFEVVGTQPDKFLNDGETLVLGNLEFKVIHTPGHSPGGVCFYCADQGVLLSGDTLFKGSIGNLSFPTADPQAMWESLAKLAKLAPNTIVYPGHGPPTTIANEPWLERAKDIFGGSS